MAKKVNYNLVKIHRNYSIEEISLLLNVHKNTVHNWIKDGLATIDDCKPLLVLGSELRQFLQDKRNMNRHPCKQDELFCVKCKLPRKPSDGIIEIHEMNNSKLRISGICPECKCLMNKFSSSSGFTEIERIFNLSLSKRR